MLIFEQKHGESYTRSNSVRPIHGSSRRYLALSVVCYLSLGLCLYMGAFWGTFDPEDPLALHGHAVLGAGFTTLGFLCMAMLMIDSLSGCLLATMGRQELKLKILKQQKSFRYEAKPAHLRGITIGAGFFGLCLILSLCFQSLIALRIFTPPT